MSKSSVNAPLGIIRSTAVISLGLVALAGSIASVLVRRILTPPAKAEPAGAQISKLVTDEWEADLVRLESANQERGGSAAAATRRVGSTNRPITSTSITSKKGRLRSTDLSGGAPPAETQINTCRT